MASQTHTNATILAHHLYDFAECEHRIALDVTLDKSLRTAPDAAMELLFEHGRRFERTIVEPLGYPAVDVHQGDWDAAFARTVQLMQEASPASIKASCSQPGAWRGRICWSAWRGRRGWAIFTTGRAT
jgi:hypothetical protein